MDMGFSYLVNVGRWPKPTHSYSSGKEADRSRKPDSSIPSYQPNQLAEIPKVGNAESMTKVIHIDSRGNLTLPKELRQRLGIKAGQIVAEETDEAIMLRVGATFPVEIYIEKRLVEFSRNNETALAGYRR